MKKIKWLLGMLLLALVPMLQSCDDDGYSIGDFRLGLGDRSGNRWRRLLFGKVIVGD